MNRNIIIAGVIGLLGLAVIITIISQTQDGRGKSKADSLYQTALAQQTKGQLAEAIRLYQELIEQFPQDQQTAQAWYKLAEIYEKEGDWLKAKQAYSKIIAEFPGFKQVSDVETKLWDANIKVLFSPVVSEKDIAYKVNPGDTLNRIARKFNTTVELIMRSNNLKGVLIRSGQRLKIPTAKYSVIVDKSQNTLTLKEGDAIFKVYPVATGKQDYFTPTGTFTIVEKLNNPDWYKRGEGIIPAGNPKNVLGTRWLGLSEPQYGIHGGATEETLGKQLTDGCVRMTNADVEELATILPRGAEVVIVE